MARRAAPLDELQQSVQVQAVCLRELLSQGLVEAGTDELISSPSHKLHAAGARGKRKPKDHRVEGHDYW